MRVHFDGHGLNDCSDEYKPRMATLSERYLNRKNPTGEDMARRINAYEYLKGLLIQRGFTDKRLEGLISAYLRED